MDQKIKNFDRNIEQLMNEHEVAPPFGMWNRIACELEAMPIAAAAAPVATALIPKRALVGIIAAALITGTAIITGYTVNSTLSNNKTGANNTVVNTQVATSPKPVEQHQTVAVVTNEVKPVVAKVKHNTNPVKAVLVAAQNVKPASSQAVVENTPPASVSNSLVIDNSNTDVPTPIEPVAKSAADNQTYYFPPIDVTTPDKKVVTETPVAERSHPSNKAIASADNDDNKGSSSGRGIKWPKNHKHPFGYGTINRNK
jgi:hypothetical protein